MLRDIWVRATTVQQPLPTTSVALVGLIALAVVWSPPGYRLVRHVITLVHEAGHALVAKLSGRRLRGILIPVAMMVACVLAFWVGLMAPGPAVCAVAAGSPVCTLFVR